MRHIPISLHAKFQGNRTIRLGEKRQHTHRQTDTLEFYKDRKLIMEGYLRDNRKGITHNFVSKYYFFISST